MSENNPPVVTVCVSTYNQEQYIEQCLRSILKQDVPFRFEVLVADDGSSDSTPELLRRISEEFSDLIVVIYRNKNIGPYANYADLHCRAKGEFVAHVDGDDYWLPGKLLAQVEFLRRECDVAAVYSNAILVSESGEVRGVFNNKIPEKFDLDFLVKGGNFLCHSSMLYRNCEGIFSPDDRKNFVDYATHIMLAQRGGLGYINSEMAAYRVCVSGALSSSGNALRVRLWDAVESIPTQALRQSTFMLAAANISAPMIIDDVRNKTANAFEWYRSIRVLKGFSKFLLPGLVGGVLVCKVASSLLRKVGVSRFGRVYRIR